MKLENLQNVLSHYGINRFRATQISGGLINSTWKITDQTASYILQKINTNVFTNPHLIAGNTKALKAHLQAIESDYFLVTEIPASSGDLIVVEEEGCFRLLPYVCNTKTVSVVQTTEQAYEAAYQFGLFTKVLSAFDARQLHTTIPHFHDLSLRYHQFLDAINSGNPERVDRCTAEISLVQSYEYLIDEWQQFLHDGRVQIRVTHHDTKISNVLFNNDNKGVCVIDLDTVMGGYFISDVGDMMRTYLSMASEEEPDDSKVRVRAGFFQAIARGYLENMIVSLSAAELNCFSKSGLWLTYMQALRFLTDYFNDDWYYGARYDEHNRVRFGNQMALLRSLSECENECQKFVQHTFS